MINLGLTRIKRLLEIIARSTGQSKYSPRWKVIHIAGTNGKGSIAAYASSLIRNFTRTRSSSFKADQRTSTDLDAGGENRCNSLSWQQAPGYRPPVVGRFISPHFIYRWDCISINDKSVDEQLFRDTEAEIKEWAGIVENDLGTRDHIEANESKLTSFEILTATAFRIFDKTNCDIAVVECGLGGKLDATNVLPDAAIACSVIASISLDHVDMLGGSIDTIIEQKLGIIRKDKPVIIADTQNDTLGVMPKILRQLKGLGCNTYMVLDKSSIEDAPGDNSNLQQVKRLLPHQMINLACAYKSVGLLCSGTTNIELRESRRNLSATLEEVTKSYPGRLQVLYPPWNKIKLARNFPALVTQTVLLDGAHNENAAEALRLFVSTHMLVGAPTIWILAFSANKDIASMLRILIQPHDRIIFSRFGMFGPVDGMDWVQSANLSDLHSVARELGIVSRIYSSTNDLSDAFKACEEYLSEFPQLRSNIVIAGSLYFISDFLRMQELKLEEE